MRKMIDVFLPVTPTPKGRPRIVRDSSTGKIKSYTPSKTKQAERDIALLVKSHMSRNSIQIIDEPVFLEIFFQFKSSEIGYMNKSPDLDNLIKTVLDACNCVLYTDDSLVSQIFSSKRYTQGEEGIYFVAYTGL